MKKILLACSLLLGITSYTDAQTLAFPEADGFGRFAKGARGATNVNDIEIYHVTNLSDDGNIQGSLRHALKKGNRFIVFDVAGVIKINSRLVVPSNVTIAGQTAPGDGVVIYGDGVTCSGAENVIMRHIRIRMGAQGSSGKDAMGLANGKNMIFDHVSVSWGLDETFSISWDNKGTEPADITIQNSIIGQGLLGHSAGGLIQTKGGISIIRTLYIDNSTRNPKVKGLNQFINNVVYNWGSGGGYIMGGDSSGPSWADVRNNYFIAGPSGSGSSAFVRANENFQIYQANNIIDGNKDGVLNGEVATESTYGSVTFVESLDAFNAIPKQHPEISNTLSAEESYNWIVAKAGASLPYRDAVDSYMIDELTSLGTKGNILNKESELELANNVGVVFIAEQQADSDNDGIPDFWEIANGLNPNDASDALVMHESGYYNIERYINSITEGQPYVKYITNILATGSSKNHIELQWTNNESNASKIIIEISTDNTEFTQIGEIPATETTYKADGLSANKIYYFRFKTVKNDIESLYSSTYKVGTEGEQGPPFASDYIFPEDGATIREFNKTTLQWENLFGTWGGLLYYNVYLGESPDNMIEIANNTRVVKLDIEIKPNTKYYWKVDTSNYFGSASGNTWSFKSGEFPEIEKVAYWPFNENDGVNAENEVFGYATAKDFTPTWIEGKVGNSISFPGIASAAFIQNHYEEIALGEESFSVELWYKSDGGNVDYYLLHKGSHAKNTSTGTTGKWFGIQYQKNSKNDRLTWGIDDDVTKSAIDVNSGSSYFNNEWTHLVCIRNIDTKKLYFYINGVLKAEGADNTGNISNTEDIVIGNTNVNFTNGIKGLIDEVSIYKGALTAEEVLFKYNQGANVGIENDSFYKNSIRVYPNPFINEFNISLPNVNVDKAYVKIYSPSGQIVFNSKIDIIDSTVKVIGLESINSGIYICNIIYGEEKASVRIIK